MMNVPAILAAPRLLASCATPLPRARSDRAPAANDAPWLRTELFFGIAPLDDAQAAAHERRWRAFSDRQIASRFPDGLTVYGVYGQWRSSGRAEIRQERCREATLIYADAARHRAGIEAIRNTWKKLTGDDSVLRVTQPAKVAF